MPAAPLRPCPHQPCAELVAVGRACPVHGVTVDQIRARRYRVERGSRQQRGYGAKWERARRIFLRRYPLCGMRPREAPPVMSRCYNEGRTSAANQVDHVIPHRGDQSLFWDRSNWQSLCDSCGKSKSAAGW